MYFMRFSILNNASKAYIFSGIITILGLFFLFAPGFRLQMGIDFVGGTEITWDLGDNQISNLELEETYKNTFGEDISPRATAVSNSPFTIVRSHTLSTEEIEKITTAIQQKWKNTEREGVATVGSTLGEYFKTQALYTILVTISAIVLFLAWSFRNMPAGISSWKFGGSALVALVHDVIIIAGVFAFLGQFMTLEVDTLFVSALLTVLGFSVHDTIVVFDRIRENMKGKSSRLIRQVVEDSLWQTMGRSINTSLSAIIVLVAMLIWGPASLFAFVFALAFGIFFGTYSSIFIASPLLVHWIENDLLQLEKEMAEKEEQEKNNTNPKPSEEIISIEEKDPLYYIHKS